MTILTVKTFEIMARINSEEQYKALQVRMEELLQANSNEEAPVYLAELEVLGNLIADYEEEHFPIAAPTLQEMLRERMQEKGLTQSELAKLLKISQARISELLTGKREPTLQLGRKIHNLLDIDSDIILGVC